MSGNHFQCRRCRIDIPIQSNGLCATCQQTEVMEQFIAQQNSPYIPPTVSDSSSDVWYVGISIVFFVFGWAITGNILSGILIGALWPFIIMYWLFKAFF